MLNRKCLNRIPTTNMWIIGIQLIPSVISGFWFKNRPWLILLKIDLQTIRKHNYWNTMLIEQFFGYFGLILNFGNSWKQLFFFCKKAEFSKILFMIRKGFQSIFWNCAAIYDFYWEKIVAKFKFFGFLVLSFCDF